MAETKSQFIWLIDSCFPRKGKKLIKGEKHKTSDYPKDVVAEWIRTKAAKFV